MDFKLIETGSGGDLVLNGNDLAVVNGFQNMPYLGMFGGNVEQSTGEPKSIDEQSSDWWGNFLLYPNKPVIQFNSLLQRKLTEVALSSSGRLQIEQAVKTDLQFMTKFSTLSVDVSITAPERIEILIKIQEPNNKQTTELVYIWDSTKNELSQ